MHRTLQQRRRGPAAAPHLAAQPRTPGHLPGDRAPCASTPRAPPRLGLCRHYTFYLWKDGLANEALRYTLIPTYIFSLWSLLASLQAAHQPALLTLGMAGAACATLVPAGLIELRCAHPWAWGTPALLAGAARRHAGGWAQELAGGPADPQARGAVSRRLAWV